MWPLYICVLILAVCSLLNKHAVVGSNPFSIQLVNVFVSICLAPIWYFLAKRANAGYIIDKATLPYVAVAGILSTVGFILFLTGLKNKPASVATSILATYPAIALLLGSALGLEKFTMAKLGGITLIMIGIIITIYSNEE